ncbi:MAG: porin [Rhodobacteraceae bacterium]|nr:porin [Paracoccaceae bacterium]
MGKMRKLIVFASALALSGSMAFAMEEGAMDEDMMMEKAPSVSVGASGEFGIINEDDDDDSTADFQLVRAYKVTFSSSGTTDGGLNFGANIGINSDRSVDEVEKSSVWIGGEMSKLTIGDVAAADKVAGGIADVGLDGGLGVDNVVEDIMGQSLAEMRYDITFGSITLGISTDLSDGAPGVANIPSADSRSFEPGSFEVKNNPYAIGMSFSASDATIGLGYDSKKTISVGLGYDDGQISANAFWAKRDQPYAHLGSGARLGGTGNEADGTFNAGYSGHGIDVSYTNGASTLTIVYAKAEVKNIQPIIAGNIIGIIPSASFKGTGIGFSQDLGGGAKLVAGFGKVPKTAVGDLGLAEIGQIVSDNDGDNDIDIADRPDLSGDMSVVSIGMEFQF